MELLKLLSASQLVAQTISFIILLIVLRIFLWERFLKILDDRKERVAAEFKKIENAKSEIAALKEDYEKKISKIEDTAKIRMQQAVEEGRRMANAIEDNARTGARKVVEGAKDAIKEELSKAREEMKYEIVDLTIKVAEKVIQAKLTTNEDKKIVEDFLNEVNEAK